MSKIPTRKTKSPYISWNEGGITDALKQTEGNIESYDGIMSSTASRRSYIDIVPNTSVRTEFLKSDYYQFRPSEDPGSEVQHIIKMCMNAYDKVGIIKNVIDLMGNFASQGITLHHTNKKIEAFYRRWWEKVNGAERSERFLNMLYRCGNVIIYRRNGKITKKIERMMTKAAAEIEVQEPEIIKKEIPFRYDFLNPLSLVPKGTFPGFNSIPIYRLNISPNLKKAVVDNNSKEMLEFVPDQIKKAVKEGKAYIDLDPEKILAFFYKKDDWQVWAKPMIHAILDDIVMLEKMKLADMSALDGAISNIRLWKLGDLEHKILPTKSSIDRLRDILASNVGGGTMDLVWGPEISFQESNTQIYKFLGSEKYQPVLSSIYGGLGIPATLTGVIGQSGGFTNNFISLKTLIEQLEYGRDLLKKFWTEEIRRVQQAMGFPEPAVLHFDFMILSDETAERNLLIQLADRDIISYETIRDRLGADNKIETSRIKDEYRKRKSGKMPRKSDPFHENEKLQYAKVSLQKGEIGIDDVTDIKAKHPEAAFPPKFMDVGPSKKPSAPNGRPKFKQDTTQRKQRVAKPRTTPGKASVIVWATEAQKSIADILHPPLLDYYGKKNLRELNKSQASELEEIKFKVLCSIPVMSEITEELVMEVLKKNPSLTRLVKSTFSEMYDEFVDANKRSPSMDEMRQLYSLAYSFTISE